MPRQYITNFSFENGERPEDFLPWHRMAGTGAMVDESFGWEIDSSEAFHGSRSLKTTTGAPLVLMEEAWAPIPLEEPWLFTLYLKADRPGVACELSASFWWHFQQESISCTVELTTEWARYELPVHGIPRLDRRCSNTQGPVNFSISPQSSATVWADALQWTRLADASENLLEGPDASFEDAPAWTLPRWLPTAPSPLKSGRGEWSGTIPLRVWRDGAACSLRQPITIGVPFKKGLWNGAGQIRLLTSDGVEIPVQTETLASWDAGQSIQVLGLFFTHVLQPGWNDLTLSIEDGEDIEPAVVQPFAWQVEPPSKPGLLWDQICTLSYSVLEAGFLRAVALDGVVYDSSWDPDARWEIERDGPLHRSIRCTGRLMNSEGRSLLAYAARLHMWRDIPGVKLEITAVNTRREGSVRLRSLGWHAADSVPEALDTPPVVVTTGYYPETDRFITRYSNPPHGAQASCGKAPLFVQSHGLLLHAPEAWQRHPSALAHRDGEWCAYLWPAEGVKVLSLPRGLALAREFWFRDAGPGDDLRAWESDPIGIAAPSWWGENSLMLPITAAAPERFPFAEGHLGGLSSLGRLAPEPLDADHAYGVFDFGDNHGDGGWANLESFNDWCALLIGLRSGNEIALRAGMRGAQHYRDIDMHQATGACYEHTFNHVAGQADMSHAWPDGVNLHYLLTGSRRSLEMALLHGEYTLSLPISELAKGLRTLGRYLFNLAEAYQLTGDARFRQRFEQQIAFARHQLEADVSNPDRSIFSYIGQWQTRRLVPFHAWYGIAALQKMEALTGDITLASLISDEIAATLNPELHHLDLHELWPGLPAEQALPLALADFARHRGSYFYPVMVTESERRHRPDLARLAELALYVSTLEGRNTGHPQAILSLSALKNLPAEKQILSTARTMLWEGAATTLLNGDFALSPKEWPHWRPIPSKSLSHHTNWQAERRVAVALDSSIRKEGPRALRITLDPQKRNGVIQLDTARFRLEPGRYTLSVWLRRSEAAVPLISLENRNLAGGFDTTPLFPTKAAPQSKERNVTVVKATLSETDADGWRRLQVTFEIAQRAVANLLIHAQASTPKATGYLWLDSVKLEALSRQEAEKTTLVEPIRETPLAGDFDVIVCGAGPAGIAAAIAAARAGANTALLEANGCLGGVWTAGLLTWIIDAGGKGGLMDEITGELDRRGARRAKGKNYAYDTEEMKFLLEELALRAGITVQLHTRVVATLKSPSPRLSGIITESTSGRQAWRAPVFIDCTGDGDLGALAGCGFDLGHPENGLTQPMSLMALVTGLHREEITPFIGGSNAPAKAAFLAEMQRAGITPSYGSPTLFEVRDDLFALMANHAYGYSALNARDITTATLECRRELHEIIRALRAHGGPWAKMRLVATGEQIGIREGRRLHGLATVTACDLQHGARQPDAVCRCTFGVDIHSLSPAHGTSYAPAPFSTLPYDIPLRALIARDVDGLLMAGRCLSGDFIAHSSYRVTGNAVATGEAAGLCAAECVARGLTPWHFSKPESFRSWMATEAEVSQHPKDALMK